jgi:hypothetical protein
MPLDDNPELLNGFARFARRINEMEQIGDDDRSRIPGLLMIARTFVGKVLEAEFGTSLDGFPFAARERVAALSARLRHRPDMAAGRRFTMTAVDLCDFEIDQSEMSGEDEEDEEAYYSEILDLISRLLDRFAEWTDQDRLPELSKASVEVRDSIGAAISSLAST